MEKFKNIVAKDEKELQELEENIKLGQVKFIDVGSTNLRFYT